MALLLRLLLKPDGKAADVGALDLLDALNRGSVHRESGRELAELGRQGRDRLAGVALERKPREIDVRAERRARRGGDRKTVENLV